MVGTPETCGELGKLFALLPRVVVDAKGQPDLPACNPELLLQIAASTQRLRRVVLCGVGGAGRCAVLTGEPPTHSDIQAVVVLVAELCDAVLLATQWTDECSRLTVDFTGGQHD